MFNLTRNPPIANHLLKYQSMTADEQSIHQIVNQLETNWNASDSAGFAAPFASDAEFVDILGRRHKGRPAIEAGHRQIFDTIYGGSRNKYTVERIRFVRPDVAIAFVHARLVSRVGGAVDDARRALRADENQPISEAQARPTLVLSMDGSRWEIVAFQNTKMAAGITETTV
jgi:uncharacterized protein (TIGR02246 family)